MSIKIPKKPRWIHNDDMYTDWWHSEIQPLVDELKNAKVMYGDVDQFTMSQFTASKELAKQQGTCTHKALLIGIEEIEPDTPEKVLKELVDKFHPDDFGKETDAKLFKLIKRAKKLLGGE